jgi:hypothetical protein
MRAMQRWRARADALSADRGQPEHDASRLSFSETFRGRFELTGSLNPVDGRLISTALDLATTEDAEGERREPAERRADALRDICEYFLNHQGTQRSPRRRPHLNVTVTSDQLHDDEPLGVFADGAPVPSWLVDALACDCNLHRLLLDGRSAILDYGRAARTAPPDLFAALAARDGGCRHPGCDRPVAWTEAHHIVPWEDGGETSITNTVLGCSRHHHLWHRLLKTGWTIRLQPDGTLEFAVLNGLDTMTSTPYGPAYLPDIRAA